MTMAQAVAEQSGTAAPRLRGFHIMSKPIGPICNIDCRYCFYLEKEALYPDARAWKMPDEVLVRYIGQYIEQQAAPEIQFAWQGGEPTLLGVRFFQRVVELQREFARGKVIHNAFQTNGTLIDEEWAAFLAKEKFLVGLSVDGPRKLHDAYRVDRKGQGTFDQVMRGRELLVRHGVEFNILTVVNRLNSQRPVELYQFLKGLGSPFVQFIPLVERHAFGVNLTVAGRAVGSEKRDALWLAEPAEGEHNAGGQVTEWSVEGQQYGRFLAEIFDYWVRHDVGRVFVQTFDSALAKWAGAPGGLCVFNETCGDALAMEHNGDVYSCDHFVYPQYKLGNLMEQDLGAMVGSSQQRQFGLNKRDSLPKYCRECEVRFACNGECPKHRFMHTPDGEPGLNYLCPGYKLFFRHVDPYMKRMAHFYRSGRHPAEIMQQLAITQSAAASGRNAPCRCGSGKKAKKCCER